MKPLSSTTTIIILLWTHTITIFSKDASFRIKLDTKRFIQSISLATSLAIGSNFVGITSNFMTNTNPIFFRSLKVDQLYGINHYQRYIDTNNKHFEFLYPDSWFIDQNILVTREIIREKPLQLQGSKNSKLFSKSPDIAFKDLNSKGKKNLSVLRATVLPGFSLSGTLGGPDEAAPKLLALIAPTSSDKTATLLDVYNARYDSSTGFLLRMTTSTVISAAAPKLDGNSVDRNSGRSGSSGSDISSESSGSGMSEPDAIVLEYKIEKESTSLNQHCVAVITYEGATDSLYTLTAMAPEGEWKTEEERIRTIALSFHLNK